jgi:hypothetical protein
VECDPRGIAPDPARCERANVRRYPTWLIAGRRYEGVMTLEELAQASRWEGASSR